MKRLELVFDSRRKAIRLTGAIVDPIGHQPQPDRNQTNHRRQRHLFSHRAGQRRFRRRPQPRPDADARLVRFPAAA